MKDRYTNLVYKYLIGGGTLGVALVIPETLLAKLLTKNNPEIYETCAFMMVFVTMSIYLVVSIVKSVQYFKWINQHEQEKLEETKKILNSQFKTVLLNSSIDIPKERFECQAKIGNDGKIICKIHLDFETNLDTYEQFQKQFHFAENEK